MILICRFVAQETFLIINDENSCSAFLWDRMFKRTVFIWNRFFSHPNNQTQITKKTSNASANELPWTMSHRGECLQYQCRVTISIPVCESLNLDNLRVRLFKTSLPIWEKSSSIIRHTSLFSWGHKLSVPGRQPQSDVVMILPLRTTAGNKTALNKRF